MDYCELVIEQQRLKYPDIDWQIEDGLNMSYPDESFDFVLDKVRNDGTTERRNNGTTERRNDGTTERRNDGTTSMVFSLPSPP